MLKPEQIAWCEKWIPSFKPCYDQALKAQQETEKNRQDMARYMVSPKVKECNQ